MEQRTMVKMRQYTLAFLMVFVLVACGESQKKIVIRSEVQQSQTNSLIQAISIIDEEHVWLSGHRGTYVTTSDGGKSWNSRIMEGADTLQFRDLHAFNEKEVVLMSAGPGTLSQIRKTVDGGESWEVKYLMQDSLGFLNSIEFWDEQRGLAFGDAINGELFVLKTEDAGDNWKRITPDKLPPALGSEGGFAASGTCIAVKGRGKAWIATGAGERPRVLYTEDYGESWEQYATPIVAGEAAGITSINFWNEQKGFIAGGDLSVTDQHTYNTAFTLDGGKIWSLAEPPSFKGSIYGAGLASVDQQQLIVVAGPLGLEYSQDLGTTWTPMDSTNYWAVKFLENGEKPTVGWATGTDGKVLKIKIEY